MITMHSEGGKLFLKIKKDTFIKDLEKAGKYRAVPLKSKEGEMLFEIRKRSGT